MSKYIEEQRNCHLLAKLKPALCTNIVTYYEVLVIREALISLAIRLKTSLRTNDSSYKKRKQGPKVSYENGSNLKRR